VPETLINGNYVKEMGRMRSKEKAVEKVVKF
jgi:hypothetical protein